MFENTPLFSSFLEFFRAKTPHDNLDEFPVLNREICCYERSLTSLYSTSTNARQRQGKNIVESITLCKRNHLQYLIIRVKHHKDFRSSVTLRIVRQKNQFPNVGKSTEGPAVPQSEDLSNHAGVPLTPLGENHSESNIPQKSKSSYHPSSQHFYNVIDRVPTNLNVTSFKKESIYHVKFTNNNFTLLDLVTIARVAQESREKRPVKDAESHWDCAMILEVAILAYHGGLRHRPSPNNNGSETTYELDVLWSASFKDRLTDIYVLFKDRKTVNEQQASTAFSEYKCCVEVAFRSALSKISQPIPRNYSVKRWNV